MQQRARDAVAAVVSLLLGLVAGVLLHATGISAWIAVLAAVTVGLMVNGILADIFHEAAANKP